MHELLEITEVAERLKVHSQTVRKLIADGKLRSVKLGSRRLVRADDLAQFIDDLDG